MNSERYHEEQDMKRKHRSGGLAADADRIQEIDALIEALKYERGSLKLHVIDAVKKPFDEKKAKFTDTTVATPSTNYPGCVNSIKVTDRGHNEGGTVYGVEITTIEMVVE